MEIERFPAGGEVRAFIHDGSLSVAAMDWGGECFDCETRLCYSERDIPRSTRR